MNRLALFLFSLVFVTPASAQQAAPGPLEDGNQPPIFYVPVPLPQKGCIWASRVFSEGAEFCFANRVVMICKEGKWSYDGSEGCNGAPAVDTK
jgi:hypothetical protein